MSVCSACHKKILQTWRLEQQTLLSPSSAGWEVQDQGCGQIRFLMRVPFLACGWPPSHSLGAHMKKEDALFLSL